MKLLSQSEIEALCNTSPGWSLEEDGKAINAQLQLASFAAAWSFMCETALAAERLDHHPEWSNVYNRVNIRLTTHDANGLTSRDAALAEAIRAALEGRRFSVA